MRGAGLILVSALLLAAPAPIPDNERPDPIGAARAPTDVAATDRIDQLLAANRNWLAPISLVALLSLLYVLTRRRGD